jgi:hypothetical protein
LFRWEIDFSERNIPSLPAYNYKFLLTSSDHLNNALKCGTRAHLVAYFKSNSCTGGIRNEPPPDAAQTYVAPLRPCFFSVEVLYRAVKLFLFEHI